MKSMKRTIIGLLALLLLAGCAPRIPAGFVELESAALCADEQLNSLLTAFNRTGDGTDEITAELVRPGDTKRQVLVNFPAAAARLTINESGLYLALEGPDGAALWPLLLHFAQVIQPDVDAEALAEAWEALQTGSHADDPVTLGNFALTAAPTEAGWAVKLHHTGQDYLGQKLLFEPSCRRRRSPLIPAKPEE